MVKIKYSILIVLLISSASLRGAAIIQYQDKIPANHINGKEAIVKMEFSLYADEDGRRILWQEDHPAVKINADGSFIAALGMHTPVPSKAMAIPILYLKIKIEGYETNNSLKKMVNMQFMPEKETKKNAPQRQLGAYQCLHQGNGITCPDETDANGSMCVVGDFCIDEYEASVVLAGDESLGEPDGTGTSGPLPPTPPYPLPNETTGIARSKPDIAPKGFMTWFQAQKLCANAGKRLCTNAEWQAAAAGTPDPFYHEDGIHKKPRSNCHYGGVEADPRAWDDRDLRYEDCVSRHGVKDMAGNVNEWTADWMNSWSYAYVKLRTEGAYRADPYNKTTRATNWLDPKPQDDDPYDGGLFGDHKDTDDRMAYIGDAANQHKMSAPKFRGFPAAIFRGGQYPMDYMGIFEIWLGQAVSEGDKWLGFRCCLTPVD